MIKSTKIIRVQECVDKEIIIYKTIDGKHFIKEQDGIDHEILIKKYPKINGTDFDWIEYTKDADYDQDQIIDAMNSNNIILLLCQSSGDNSSFEIVEPNLLALKTSIKYLNKTIGCGCNQYVSGIIYKQESFCFKDKNIKFGNGRNIKIVLKNKE